MDQLLKARNTVSEIDRELASLFIKRMEAVKEIAYYKEERGLPILDEAREKEILEAAAQRIDDDALRSYYLLVQKELMRVSRAYQQSLIRGMRVAYSGVAGASYPITVERGALDKVGSLFDLDRRVLIVTDDGVPKDYAEKVAKASGKPTLITLPAGEDTKSLQSLETLLATMLENGFTRKDCVVAVGGGVVGDLSGFAASVYMRGIDFYNIPTTLLAEVDSSIGGKTAINFGGIKNPVGTFYQPKAVLIDPDVLKTLPKRHIAAGLAECIKMALTFDEALFSRLEAITDPLDAIEEIIISSLKIKKAVVEEDEKEAGLRRVLNFGHTLGHAIESEQNAHGLFHGECVALGMLPMCAESVRARLLPLLAKLSLPTTLTFDLGGAKKALRHDKKSASEGVACIFVQKIGSYEIKTLRYEELDQLLDYFR